MSETKLDAVARMALHLLINRPNRDMWAMEGWELLAEETISQMCLVLDGVAWKPGYKILLELERT